MNPPWERPLAANLPHRSRRLLLLNEELAQGVSNAELARRLGTHPQEVQRTTDLSHATKIDTIAKALRAMGLQ